MRGVRKQIEARHRRDPIAGIDQALRVALLLVSSTALIAVGFGCGGDKGTDPTVGTGTVSGVVQNVNGNATIAGATVTASSGATATTDAQGRFSISVPSGQRVRIDVTKATYSLNQLVVQLATGESKSFAVGLMAACAVVFLFAPGLLLAAFGAQPEVFEVGRRLLAIAATFQVLDAVATHGTAKENGMSCVVTGTPPSRSVMRRVTFPSSSPV